MSMQRRPFSIVLIGPHSLLREGLTHILSAAHFRVVASATSLEDLAASAIARSEPLLLIIDSNGDADIVLPQIRSFKDHQPDGRVASRLKFLNLPDARAVYRVVFWMLLCPRLACRDRVRKR